MSSKKISGPESASAANEEEVSDRSGHGHPADQGAVRTDRGQDGAAGKDKGPTAIIAGKDGPQTGGHERGNPGVGG